MNRKILEGEKIYRRVRDYITSLPSEVLANLRIYLTNSETIDYLRKQISKDIGITLIENQTYMYSFWYGEKELYELLRQII